MAMLPLLGALGREGHGGQTGRHRARVGGQHTRVGREAGGGRKRQGQTRPRDHGPEQRGPRLRAGGRGCPLPQEPPPGTLRHGSPSRPQADEVETESPRVNTSQSGHNQTRVGS